MRKHLPVDALAHPTLPLQEGLTHFPLVLHAPPPPRTNIPPPRTHEKDLASPCEPALGPCSSKTEPPMRSRPHTISTLPLPTPVHGPGEVCGRKDPHDATGKKLPGRPPLLVQREPRPNLLSLWNRARILATRHPHLPRPPKGPGPPTERGLLPRARRHTMDRTPSYTSHRLIHHRHKTQFSPGDEPRLLPHPLTITPDLTTYRLSIRV